MTSNEKKLQELVVLLNRAYEKDVELTAKLNNPVSPSPVYRPTTATVTSKKGVTRRDD